jgi:hypothetical protein
MKEKVDSFIERQKVFREQYLIEARALFKEIISYVFEKNPNINSIKWIQYTPYFNDGDECVFSVHEPSFTNAVEDDDLDNISYGEYNGDNEDIFSYYAYRAEDNKDVIDPESIIMFNDFVMHEVEDILRDMFGDHVEVIATREGFKVQEYDHD